MVQRLPSYFMTMQRVEGSGASALDGDEVDDAKCIGSGQKQQKQQQKSLHANGGGCSRIKVNVKQLNRDYDEHNLNGEISLIIGDAQTNKLLFHRDQL